VKKEKKTISAWKKILLKFLSAESKPKKYEFKRCQGTKCARCDNDIFIQTNRKKEFVDDWDSNCFVCFNEKCSIYGRPVIVVYDPFTFQPSSSGIPKEKDPVIFQKEDSNVVIVND